MVIVTIPPVVLQCIYVIAGRVIAGVMLVYSREVWQVILARFCDGVALAFTFVVLSTYTAEIADKNIRGSLGAIIQISRSFGVVGMFCIGPFLSYYTLHVTYLVLIVASVLPIVFLPESPYFLYSKGRVEESTKILTTLRRTYQEVEAELKMFAKNRTSKEVEIRQLIKNRTFLKAVGIVFVLSGVGPITGFSFIDFYLQDIMETADTGIKSELASVVVGIVQLVACFCPIFLTDKFGRKPILIVSVLVMAVGMIGLGTFFWCKEAGYKITSFLNVLPLLSAAIVNFGHNAGFTAIQFILIPELFIGPQRAIGVSVGFLTLAISTFAVTKSYYALLTSIGPYASYWMFSSICVVFSVFVTVCVPETKGKMFHEIQEGFGIKKDGRVEC